VASQQLVACAPHARFSLFLAEFIMRRTSSASLRWFSVWLVSWLAAPAAFGEEKVGLTPINEPASVNSQQSVAGASSTSVGTMPRSMPRFAPRSVVSRPAPSYPFRTPIQPRGPQPMHRASKPFETVERDPTISPYLNLDRDEDDSQDVPSYFTFVRPQLEQIQTNRLQQRELQRLQGQMQGISTQSIAPQSAAIRAAGVSSPARFMDTAQFYGGYR
jgi:hypothetical protein